MNAEIVARLEGTMPAGDDGEVRLWLPSDLIQRIEAKARANGTNAEIEARFALEDAFPYEPTLGDVIDGLLSQMQAEDGVGGDMLERLAELLTSRPDLASRPFRPRERGHEVGPRDWSPEAK